MNTQINITENGTTTLATAGKYCDRNIDVNVEVVGATVMDADGILDCTFSGAYVSDKLTTLKTQAFMDLKNVTSVSLPNCTTLNGKETFRGATSLTSVSLPNCTTMGNGVFHGNSSLVSVYLPNLITMENKGVYNFHGTKKLTELDLPNLTTITDGTNATFYNMALVTKINLPKLSGTTIGGATFSGCTVLNTLILGGDVLNPLGATDAFGNTPIKSGNGYVYVPDNLVDAYKTATNWVTFADQIKPMSELEG